MAQFARPISDVGIGSWGTAPLWSKIDEATPSEADFIQAPADAATVCTLGLTNLQMPSSTDGHVIRVRAKKGAAGGNARGLDYTLYAWVGSNYSPIRSSSFSTDLTDVWTTYTDTIGPLFAADITSYEGMTLELTASGSVSGKATNKRTVEVSWLEFEIPDPAVVIPTRSVSDPLLLNDSVVVTTRRAVAVVDALPLADAATIRPLRSTTVSDALPLNDSVAASVGASPPRVVAVSDTLPLNDALVVRPLRSVQVSEALPLVDVTVNRSSRVVAVSESLALLDNVLASIPGEPPPVTWEATKGVRSALMQKAGRGRSAVMEGSGRGRSVINSGGGA